MKNSRDETVIPLRCRDCVATGFFQSSSLPQLPITVGTFDRSFSSAGISTVFGTIPSYPRITRPNTTAKDESGSCKARTRFWPKSVHTRVTISLMCDVSFVAQVTDARWVRFFLRQLGADVDNLIGCVARKSVRLPERKYIFQYLYDTRGCG